MSKLTLPPTEVFYRRSMKRSAEIKAMSTQQIMDEAGVKNMLEGRTINLQCFGSKSPGKLTMENNMSNTESCWFQVDSVWYRGTLREFSTESHTVAQHAWSGPVGIVEDESGRLHSIDVNDIIIQRRELEDALSPPPQQDDGPIPRQPPQRAQ